MRKYFLFFTLPMILLFSGCTKKAIDQTDRLVVLPVKNDPTTTIKVMFNAGSAEDPKGKEGLAYLTAKMIFEGSTKYRSYENMLENLSSMAADYSVLVSTESTVFTGRVHRDNLSDFYDIFGDAILNPGFSQDDFNRIQENAISYLESEKKNSSDEELARSVLQDKVYGGTPYGHQVEGSLSGLRNISLKDVVAFYRKYYTRDNFRFGVGGGYMDDFVDRAFTQLNRLPEGERNLPLRPSPKQINGLDISIIEKSAPGCAISIGFPISAERGTKEYYALSIANAYIGGLQNLNSKLCFELRQARGLSCGAYSSIEQFPNPSPYGAFSVNCPRKSQLFEIWISPVSEDNAAFALKTALCELERLVDKGISKADFENTKDYLRKRIDQYAPDTETRLGYTMDDKFYRIKGGHLRLFKKMLNKISLKDVNRAIRNCLQYNDLKVVMVSADAAKLRSVLLSQSPTYPVYLDLPCQRVLREDYYYANYRLNASYVRIIDNEELFK